MRDKIKKFLGLFLCVTLALGGFSNVFASSNVLRISSVEISSKSAGVEAETPSVENYHVQGDVVFNVQGDHIEYLFTIENTDKYAYKIDNITDNNSTEKLAIIYSHDEKIDANSTATFSMLMEYSDQLINQEKLDIADLEIEIHFTRIGGPDDGKDEEVDVNPNTSASDSTNVVVGGIFFSSIVLAGVVLALRGILPRQFRIAGSGAALLLASSAIGLQIVSAAQQEEVDVQFANVELVGIIENYTITIDTGDGPVERHLDYGTPLSEILNRPSRAGYHFLKWIDGNGNTIDENGIITGPIEITAVMEANKYHVVFNANGGTGEMAKQEFTYDDTAKKLSANTFERAGYSFAGWSTIADGAKAYDDEEEVVNLTTTTEDYNLYAKWTKLTDITYTVKHHYAGLTSGYVEVVREEAGAVDEDIYPPILEREGFNNPSTITPIRINPDGSTVAVLEYSRKSYAFAYGDSEFIDASASASAGDYKYEAPIVVKAKNRNGYQFAGWSDGSNIVSSDNPYSFDLPLEGITLTPTYKANTYHVVFHANGGTGEMMNQEYTFDDEAKALSKNLFERAGYDFAGWATSADGEVAYADKAEVRNLTDGAGDIDFYAKWVKKTNIHYVLVHRYEKLTEGYDEEEEPHDDGSVDTDISLVVKPRTGFDTPTARTVQIAADGSTVEYYTYNRLRVDFTLNDPDNHVTTETGTGEYKYGAQISLAAENLEGYQFLGWNNGSSIVSTDANYSFDITDDTTLTPDYQANTYHVVFNANNGTGSMENQEFTYDEVAKKLSKNTFTRAGYDFAGWATSADGEVVYADEQKVQNLTSAADDVNLYAKWTANTYNVSFHSNGGDGSMDDQSFTYGEVAKALTVNAFTRTGYSFDGWALTVGGEKAYDDEAQVQNITSDIDLYARWVANSYNVVFHSNDGNDLTESQAFIYDEPAKNLRKNTFERIGYSFAGWATSADGAKVYDDEGQVQNLTDTTNNVDLYAVWTAHTYYVHFHANSGDGSMSEQSFTYGEATKALTANTFTRTGYSFAGWATSAGGEKEYDDEAQVQNLTSDIDLYALWNANTYHVIFHSNDGNDSTESQEFVFDEVTKALRANSFAREGYSFAGWAESASGQVVYADEAQVQNLTTTTNDVNLYAKWNANTYYVTFHANNGAGSMEKQPFTYGEAAKALTANTFTRTGYSFAGWAESGSGEVVYADEVQVQNLTSDIDLYAKWTANAYTVVFHSNEGSGLTESQGFTYDEGSKALRKNTFTYDGYNFIGWAESASGQVVYDDEEEVENLVETTEDVNLYARWEARTDIHYVLIHHYESLTEGYDNVEEEHNDGSIDTDIPLAIQPRTGFVNPTARTARIAADGSTVEDYYYARVRVDLVLNDVDRITTNTPSGEYKYGETISLTANEKPGYHFTGWSNGQSIVSNDTTYSFEITQTTTLTPAYEANDYNVVFHSNFEPDSTESQEFTFDETAKNLRANIFERPGYTFVGWATSAGGAVVYADEAQAQNLTTTTDDFNLYAKWALRTDIEYTVHHRYENVGAGFTEVDTTEYGSVDTDITPPTAPETGFDDPVADASTPVPTRISADGTSEVIYNYYRLYKNLTIVDGADISGATSGSYKYGTQFELTAANRQGYKFAGWTIDGGESIISANKTYSFVLTDDITIQPVYDEAQFYDVFRHDGACVFDGNGNVTGDDCGDNHGYINTNVKLYDATNYEGDYEIGFTIDALGSTQVNQATIVNSKFESNSANYPGVAARKVSNGNDIEITQRINGGNPSGSPANKTAWAAPKTIKIIRYKNVVYTQVGNETPKRLQSMAGTSSYHDIPVWFGATYVPPSGGNEGYADRLFNGTLSHMYIKQGEYDGATATITFDMNGDTGTAPDPISVLSGTTISTLSDEIDSGSDQVFMGWYRDKDVWLDRVTKNDALTQDVTVYARWASSSDVCLVKDVVGQNDEISDVTKTKLKDCVDIINDNVDMPTGEIVILHDINPATEAGGNNDIHISSGKDITITGDGYRLTANTSQPIFRNDRGGTLRLDNIKMNTKAGQAIVNNEAYNNVSSSLYVKDCELTVGDSTTNSGSIKQAIYNVGSTVEISGNTIIESYSSIRAPVYGKNGSITIRSGKIVAHKTLAVDGTDNGNSTPSTTVITIGDNSNAIDKEKPVIVSETNYAVAANVGVSVYDGTLIGKQGALKGSTTITSFPSGAIEMTAPWTTDYDNTYYWLYYGTSSGP